MNTTIERPAYGFRGNLSYYRHLMGLSSRELGAMCGISHSAILRYEKGLRCPSPATLAAITKALSLTYDQLFEGEKG